MNQFLCVIVEPKFLLIVQQNKQLYVYVFEKHVAHYKVSIVAAYLTLIQVIFCFIK